MRELSFAELDTERTELLPTRETLTFGNTNWANIVREQLVHGPQRCVRVRRWRTALPWQTINVYQG